MPFNGNWIIPHFLEMWWLVYQILNKTWVYFWPGYPVMFCEFRYTANAMTMKIFTMIFDQRNEISGTQRINAENQLALPASILGRMSNLLVCVSGFSEGRNPFTNEANKEVVPLTSFERCGEHWLCAKLLRPCVECSQLHVTYVALKSYFTLSSTPNFMLLPQVFIVLIPGQQFSILNKVCSRARR